VGDVSNVFIFMIFLNFQNLVMTNDK